MSSRLRVAVLAGGRSREHEISLAAARSVAVALDPARYETTTIEIGRDGRWALPGGWADVGESPSEAVTREVREESGYETRAAKLLAVANLGRYQDGRPLRPNIYKLFVRCELVSAEQGALIGAETGEARFFGEDELPELSAPRGTREQLARLFEHARNPDLPTDFD